MDCVNLTASIHRCMINVSNISKVDVELQKHHRELFFNIIGSFATVFIPLVTFLGNSAVVIVYFGDERLRSQVGNSLIMYLALTDVCTSVLVILPSAVAVAMDFWPFGFFLCKMTAVFFYTLACSSSYLIGLISLDRAIAVLYPFKYNTIVTKKVVFCFCSVASTYSLIFGLLCGLPDYTTFNYAEASCAIDYTSKKGLFIIVTGSFTCYLMPAVVVITCNILIMLAAKKSGKIAQILFVRRYPPQNKINTDTHTRKTIKSMIVLVCAYYICFTPYVTFKQLTAIGDYEMPVWINYLTTLFIYMSSSVNPFIYGILRKDFRNGFKKLPRLVLDKFPSCKK